MNMTTVPSNQLKAMQHEIESLKEQVAYLEELNRKLCDKANQLTIMDARAGETIAQQAEAIRLKDEALDWCIGEFNLRLDDIDLSQETIRVLISVLSARHIQHSPEILQARDEPAPEAITPAPEAITKYLRAVGVLSYEGTALQGIISGEWRKYL